MRKFIIALALILLSFTPVRSARAQALADRVPNDSLVYFGWKGTDTPDNGFAGSHFQAVLTASNLRPAIEQILPQVLAMADKQDAEFGAVLRSMLDIGEVMMKHPTAAFVRPGDKEGTPVRGGFICQAGPDSKVIATKVGELLANAKSTGPAIRVVESGDVVGVMIGYDEAGANAAVSKTAGADALGANAKFLGSMKQTIAAGTGANASPFVTFYADVQGAAGLFKTLIAADGEQNAAEFARFTEVSGLSGLHRLIVTANFDGPGWTTSSFIEAPGPRRGLVKLFEGRTVEPDVLKMIPASAGGAQIFRFDFAALATEIRNIADTMVPGDGGANFDRVIGAGQMYLGANPMTDIFEPLGDTWMLFTDEAIAGNGSAGNVLVNKLDDAEKAKRGIGAIWRAGQNFLAPRAKETGVTLTDEKIGDVTVSVVRTPQISVAWTINNGRFVIARDAASAVKASTLAPASGLDQNESFAKLAKQLAGGNSITSFRYMDLPKTAAVRHQELAEAYNMARAIVGQQGVNLLQDVLPPLEMVRTRLFPSADVSWTTDAGFFSRMSLPFPGADTYSGAPNAPLMQTGGTALAVSILLPSLNRARETANRVKCASNERQIGMAMLMYANDNKGSYPPDLGTLILTQDITTDQFICPSGDTSKPKELATMQPPQIADWVNKHADYVYAGAGLRNDTPAKMVVVYEKPDDHSRDGMNCLFGDGHVEFVRLDDPRLVEAQDRVKGK